MVLIRHGINRFFTALDSEGVALFQVIVYAHIVLAGAYGLIVAGGTPQAVEDVMGPVSNAVWLWLCSGAAVCLLGKMLRGNSLYAGMWLQFAGDVAVVGMLAVYVYATLETSWFGQAMFAVFLCNAIGICTMLLAVRDVRRLIQTERDYQRRKVRS